jgi:c-di-GMP-binding flagellar brake protein YcgR
MDYAKQRKHPRFQVKVPLEIHAEGSNTPFRCATADLSLGGCYLETMFPFPVGASLELKLQLEGTLLIVAKVVAHYPLVGNGIQFVRILPEDLEELRAFLDSLATQENTQAEKKS